MADCIDGMPKHGGEDLTGYWASRPPLEVAAAWSLVVGTDKDIRDGDSAEGLATADEVRGNS